MRAIIPDGVGHLWSYRRESSGDGTQKSELGPAGTSTTSGCLASGADIRFPRLGTSSDIAEPDGDREAAIMKQLAPSAYTAIVRGMRDSTGIALIEAYHLPE